MLNPSHPIAPRANTLSQDLPTLLAGRAAQPGLDFMRELRQAERQAPAAQAPAAVPAAPAPASPRPAASAEHPREASVAPGHPPMRARTDAEARATKAAPATSQRPQGKAAKAAAKDNPAAHHASATTQAKDQQHQARTDAAQAASEKAASTKDAASAHVAADPSCPAQPAVDPLQLVVADAAAQAAVADADPARVADTAAPPNAGAAEASAALDAQAQALVLAGTPLAAGVVRLPAGQGATTATTTAMATTTGPAEAALAATTALDNKPGAGPFTPNRHAADALAAAPGQAWRNTLQTEAVRRDESPAAALDGEPTLPAVAAPAAGARDLGAALSALMHHQRTLATDTTPRGAGPAEAPSGGLGAVGGLTAAAPVDVRLVAVAAHTGFGAPATGRTTEEAPTTPTPPLYSSSIDTPVTDAGFGSALASKLTLLSRDGVREAELSLHPADMGPILVQIAVEGAATRIDFRSDVAATRAAIEASLPSLAASLRESGLTLTGGGVMQHNDPGRRGERDGQPGRQGKASADDGLEVQGTSAVLRATTSRGMVDLFA